MAGSRMARGCMLPHCAAHVSDISPGVMGSIGFLMDYRCLQTRLRRGLFLAAFANLSPHPPFYKYLLPISGSSRRLCRFATGSRGCGRSEVAEGFGFGTTPTPPQPAACAHREAARQVRALGRRLMSQNELRRLFFVIVIVCSNLSHTAPICHHSVSSGNIRMCQAQV